MAALNADGRVVAIGDSVTIMGSVDVVTGSGSLATVTVLPLLTWPSSSLNRAGGKSGERQDHRARS